MPGGRSPPAAERRSVIRLRAQGAQVRCLVYGFAELDYMTGIAAGRELNQAKPVASKVEPHGLGIDRHGLAELETVGQIVLVEFDIQDDRTKFFPRHSGARSILMTAARLSRYRRSSRFVKVPSAACPTTRLWLAKP